MKTLLISLLTLSSIAQAAPRVLFDRQDRATLRDFSLFLDSPLSTAGRATLAKVPGGFTARPGGSGFTLYKFAELTRPDFNLRAVFRIPGGIRYSNSGIYFLYTDPTRPVADELPPRERDAFRQALENARQRAQRFGSGPYEADFFARELQIIAGFEPNLPPENFGPGAFYGVNPVTGGEVLAGHQVLQPYSLFIGDRYELTVEARGRRIKTFLRSLGSSQERVLVSDFLNVDRSDDPIRGGSPIALMLQAFPSNGADVQGPVFENLSIEEL